jgi:hypothetical protein
LIHKNIERIKLNNDKLNANSRIKCVEFAGVNNNNKTPHIGRVIRVESSEFIMKILFKDLLPSVLPQSGRRKMEERKERKDGRKEGSEVR